MLHFLAGDHEHSRLSTISISENFQQFSKSILQLIDLKDTGKDRRSFMLVRDRITSSMQSRTTGRLVSYQQVITCDHEDHCNITLPGLSKLSARSAVDYWFVWREKSFESPSVRPWGVHDRYPMVLSAKVPGVPPPCKEVGVFVHRY